MISNDCIVYNRASRAFHAPQATCAYRVAGPGPFNGFVRTLNDAKAEFAKSWRGWLEAAGLIERDTIGG
jgi:hypothetical protein